ncbi:MAG TPA: DUF1343 domain-containing protein [Chitinispirillaceae bacterium]|nr:DUF1343 domain-containing protein [Chitinispirillaceae bacterium]
MTRFGLDCFIEKIPSALKGKRLGVVCHAASINSSWSHIVDILSVHPDCRLAAIFGPQHGIYGQTQDNMIEWEGGIHPVLKIPVFSLYGKLRKPSASMLEGIDALVFDIQDVGARPYTYVWTLKLCMEACLEAGLPIYVLDRPNPIGCVPFDGPMLSPDFFSFVGGASIPLCHRLTMGEMALILKKVYFPESQLEVIWMQNWWRSSLWPQTALPWVLPSPNMPSVDTAVVYPGMVLIEATNMSEGRGTTRPFEIIGAPYINISGMLKSLYKYELEGCLFREHGFIPTFQKWQGRYCNGLQVHVTDAADYLPVLTTVAIFASVMENSSGEFQFKSPPYEYETEKMPFDILSGDSSLRNALVNRVPLEQIKSQWQESYKPFIELFNSIVHYPEYLS